MSLLPPLTLSEEVTTYLELASVHNQLGHTHEATKVIQDAINEFTGTLEEFRYYMIPYLMYMVKVVNGKTSIVIGSGLNVYLLRKEVGFI